MDAMNLEQKHREEARWRILRVLDAGRPIAVSETIVWRVLAEIKLAITLNTLRRELAICATAACSKSKAKTARTGTRG